MFSKTIKLSSGLIIIFLFINYGCSSINLQEFKPKSMQKNKYSSVKKDLKSENKKIAIIKIDNGKSDLAKNLNLGNIISNEIKNELSLIGIQSIITNDKSNINSNDFKYIIDGKINNVTYGYEYLAPAPSITITGKTVMSPAKHEYTSCINGFLDIKKVSSLEIVKSIPFEKCKSKTECAKNPKKRSYTSLIIENARDALKSIKTNIKNFFGHRGYISEQRTNGKTTIVKTTLGRKYGAKRGENVEFFTIKGDTKTLIGNGVISNQITDNTSWVIVDSLNEGAELKVGDFIKIKYEKGFFD